MYFFFFYTHTHLYVTQNSAEWQNKLLFFEAFPIQLLSKVSPHMVEHFSNLSKFTSHAHNCKWDCLLFFFFFFCYVLTVILCDTLGNECVTMFTNLNGCQRFKEWLTMYANTVSAYLYLTNWTSICCIHITLSYWRVCLFGWWRKRSAFSLKSQNSYHGWGDMLSLCWWNHTDCDWVHKIDYY